MIKGFFMAYNYHHVKHNIYKSVKMMNRFSGIEIIAHSFSPTFL